MQEETIVLIPPTHEQTIFTFHVEESVSQAFLTFLKDHGITPWRPPEVPAKSGSDGKRVVQIEIDTNESETKLRALRDKFLAGQK